MHIERIVKAYQTLKDEPAMHRRTARRDVGVAGEFTTSADGIQ